MGRGRIVTRDGDIRDILTAARTIAVLGLSPKAERDSHRVAKYLQENGYRIIPVRPAQKEVLGEKAFSCLDDIDEAVDIIDAFRKPEQMTAHAEEALRMHPNVFWMQEGIENREAAEMLTDAGIDVVMNRCIKVAHERLVKKKSL